MKRGDEYNKLQKCIHVSILDFIHFPDDQECYRKIHFRDDKTGKVYSDKMAKTNEYLEEAYETLLRLSEDEEVQRLYYLRRKAQLDHDWMMYCMKQEGLEAGRLEGIETGRLEGIAAGRLEGIETGEARLGKLILRLTEDGRHELIPKAASDPEFRQDLLKEYGLI